MGDCRIRIQISKRIIDPSPSTSDHLISIATKVYSADTSIEEVFELTTVDFTATKTTLRALINSDSVSVWDCTTHPSIDITHQCRYDIATCRTRTLYSTGWYPSGYVSN